MLPEVLTARGFGEFPLHMDNGYQEERGKESGVSMERKEEYRDGFKKGIPIGLGYLPVSFTFGVMAAAGGIPVSLAIFTSLSNLTSAGQFAGTKLIIAGAGYFEIALTTFVINIRYMLMSLSLSQKMEEGIGFFRRLLIGYGVTDEVFAIASVEKKKLTAPYMYGLFTAPVIGWTLGTALGALISGLLVESVANAMGIALYAMFIAIIVPPAKKSKPIVFTIFLAVALMVLMQAVPAFSGISEGFRVIIATVAAAGVSAFLFPVREEKAAADDVKEDAEQENFPEDGGCGCRSGRAAHGMYVQNGQDTEKEGER